MSDSRYVYSFDVFDTAICRTIYPPMYVWLEAGRRLCRDRGLQQDEQESFAHAYAAQRLAAEKKALTAGGREDVKLHDVYRHFTWLGQAGITPRDAMERELALEVEIAGPIVETSLKIERLQTEGDRVIFISDTYFSKHMVLRLLRRAGYRVEPHQVYVSAAIGLTKHSGNLFRHVLEREGITARQLRHHGDNGHSDVISAVRAGVHGEYFSGSLPTRYERGFGRHLSLEPSVTANCVGLLRSVRMGEADAAVGPVVASGVAAPLVTCFASWALQLSQRHHADLVLFIARDGEIIHQAATVLSSASHAPLRVFETSRRSISSCLLDEKNEETFAELLTEPERAPLREILRRFHLDAQEIEGSVVAERSLLDETRAKWTPQEVMSLLRKAELLERVLERAQEAKASFRAYCADLGLLASRRPLFLDIGWAGSYQKILPRMFAAVEITPDWRLGYFGLVHLPVSNPHAAARCVAFVHRLGTHGHECETTLAYTRHVEVVEAVCTPSPRGPVITYTRDGGVPRAVRRDVDPRSREAVYASALHRNVVKFAHLFKAKEFHLLPAETFRTAVLANLNTFLQEPRAAELRHLVGLQYLSGYDNSKAAAQPLALTISSRDAFRLLLARVVRPLGSSRDRDLRRRVALARMTWPEAARVLMPRWERVMRQRVPTPGKAKLWFRGMLIERSQGPIRSAVRAYQFCRRLRRPR